MLHVSGKSKRDQTNSLFVKFHQLSDTGSGTYLLHISCKQINEMLCNAMVRNT